MNAYGVGVRMAACFAVPLACLFVLAMIAGEGEPFLAIFVICPSLWIAAAACESVIAALLARHVVARGVPGRVSYQFWRTICRCFSGHLLVSTASFCLTLGLVLLVLYAIRSQRLGGAAILLTLPYAAVGLNFLWWWYCLGQAIVARGAACPARTVIVFLIPGIGLAAILLGVGLGFLVTWVAAAVCFGAR